MFISVKSSQLFFSYGCTQDRAWLRKWSLLHLLQPSHAGIPSCSLCLLFFWEAVVCQPPDSVWGLSLMRGRRGKKDPLPGANWDSCSCRAGGPWLDESPCSPVLGAWTACLQAVGAHPGILALCKPAVFQAAMVSAFSPAFTHACIAPEFLRCLPSHCFSLPRLRLYLSFIEV